MEVSYKIYLRQERDYEFDEFSNSGYQTPNGKYSLVINFDGQERNHNLTRAELVQLLFEGATYQGYFNLDLSKVGYKTVKRYVAIEGFSDDLELDRKIVTKMQELSAEGWIPSNNNHDAPKSLHYFASGKVKYFLYVEKLMTEEEELNLDEGFKRL